MYNYFSQLLRLAFVLVGAVYFFVACGGGNNTALESGDALEAGESSTSADTYVFNTASSYVSWIGSKVTEKHDGRFPISEGYFAFDGDALTSGAATIDIQHISVANPEDPEEKEKLRQHLLSADFFEAETFPTATFELVSVSAYEPTAFSDSEEYDSPGKPAAASEHRVENPTHNMTGNLIIRGETRSITFPVRLMRGTDGSLQVEAKFNIDRSEWGIQYGDENSVVDKAKDRFIYNTVNVGFYLEAVLETQTNNEAIPQENDQDSET